MKPDLILANSPYGKPGVDITKYIMENFTDANYAMLNTRTAFKKYYDKLACAFVQIGKYELGSNQKLDWVEQAILLATNGWTEVVDNRKKGGKNNVGVGSVRLDKAAFTDYRTSHLVGVNHIWLDHTGCMGRTRSTHLAQMSQGKIPQEAYTRLRNATLVQMSCADTLGAAATHRRSATLVTDKDYQHLSGYMYVAFETFEEACECAIDIISWTNPTDSHYRCVRWGFVTGLVPHYKSITLDNIKENTTN